MSRVEFGHGPDPVGYLCFLIPRIEQGPSDKSRHWCRSGPSSLGTGSRTHHRPLAVTAVSSRQGLCYQLVSSG